MTPAPRVSRWAGAAAAGTLALAVLVGGCVFTALAGPAFSLHTRTEALRQTLAGVASTDKTVQMTAGWSDFTSLNGLFLNGGKQGLAPADLDASLSELSAGLAGMQLPLAAGAWASVTTRLLTSTLSAPPPGGAPGELPVSLEVGYRDPLAGYAQVVAGSYAGPVPPGAVGVAATTQTANLLGLRLGGSLRAAHLDRQHDRGRHRDRPGARPRLGLLGPGPDRRRADAQHPAAALAVLGGRAVRRPGPAHRDAERVRPVQHDLELGVPARRRRGDRGPGAGAVRQPEPGHRGHPGPDR